MSKNFDPEFNEIYSRVAPEINIPGLTTELSNSIFFPCVEVFSSDYRVNVSLHLAEFFDKSGRDFNDIENYRWEYMDCVSGAIIESNLGHTATAKEITDFFKDTMETDESVIKL